jgi:hypothetical protein
MRSHFEIQQCFVKAELYWHATMDVYSGHDYAVLHPTILNTTHYVYSLPSLAITLQLPHLHS